MQCRPHDVLKFPPHQSSPDVLLQASRRSPSQVPLSWGFYSWISITGSSREPCFLCGRKTVWERELANIVRFCCRQSKKLNWKVRMGSGGSSFMLWSPCFLNKRAFSRCGVSLLLLQLLASFLPTSMLPASTDWHAVSSLSPTVAEVALFWRRLLMVARSSLRAPAMLKVWSIRSKTARTLST